MALLKTAKFQSIFPIFQINPCPRCGFIIGTIKAIQKFKSILPLYLIYRYCTCFLYLSTFPKHSATLSHIPGLYMFPLFAHFSKVFYRYCTFPLFVHFSKAFCHFISYTCTVHVSFICPLFQSILPLYLIYWYCKCINYFLYFFFSKIIYQ